MLENMHDNETIYLDHAAATPMEPAAIAAMEPYLAREFYNPSAPYGPARQVKAALEDARARIAHLMGAHPGALVFTAGATEANNLALAAADGEVLVAAGEHASVLAAARARGGSTLALEADGTVLPETLERALTPDVAVVSVAYADGEVGTVRRLRDLAAVVEAERARRLAAGQTRPLLFHSDCSQAAAHLSMNVSSLRADLLTVSAAKLGGPKQVGLLWTADGVRLRPLVFGGGQEGGVRSGTENVAGIMGFAAAFEERAARRAEEGRRLSAMRDCMQGRLRAAFPHAVFSGPVKNARRLPNLLHVAFPGLSGSRLVVLLEHNGVLVGTGAACAASKMQVSPVLAAIGLSEEEAAGSLRITFGPHTGEAEAARATDIIIEVVRAEQERVAGGGAAGAASGNVASAGAAGTTGAGAAGGGAAEAATGPGAASAGAAGGAR